MTDDELQHHARHALDVLDRARALLERIERGDGSAALLTSVSGQLDAVQSIINLIPATKPGPSPC